MLILNTKRFNIGAIWEKWTDGNCKTWSDINVWTEWSPGYLLISNPMNVKSWLSWNDAQNLFQYDCFVWDNTPIQNPQSKLYFIQDILCVIS